MPRHEIHAEPVATIDCNASLGEGVVWDPLSETAMWVDIEGARLFRSAPPFDDIQVFEAPERIGSFALMEGQTERVLAAFETGFGVFHPATGKVEWLARPALPPGVRFNDGRTDRQGRFWAGTMVEAPAQRDAAGGVLYRLDGPGRAEPVLSDIRISNSLCWSPDGATMYFADTPLRTIWSFRMHDGRPVERTVFAQTDAGAPDGSTIDAEGCLWNAEWGAGRVTRYRPDGTVDGVVRVPAPNASCVALGGPDLDLLFVTTARVELDEAALRAAPLSGSVFVYRVAARGLAESRCTIAGR